MKNLTIRLATSLSVLVLGAFAIALAQFDARNRPREKPPATNLAAQKATPITVSQLDSTWLQSEKGIIGPTAVVRANDGLAKLDDVDDPPLPDINPLRESANSQVVLAADTQPLPPLPKIPSSSPSDSKPGPEGLSSAPLMQVPPAWLEPANGNRSGQLPGNSNPKLPPPAGISQADLPSSPALSTSLPRPPEGAPLSTNLPQFPGQSSSTLAQPLPETLNAKVRTQIQNPSSATTGSHGAQTNTRGSPTAQSMPAVSARDTLSDTQYPAMTPTDLNAATQPTQYLQNSQNAQSRGLPSNTLPSSTISPRTHNSPITTNQWPNASDRTLPVTAQPDRHRDSSLPSGEGSLPVQGASNPLVSSMQQAPTAAVASLVSNEPGSRFLDGPQNGSMLIQKRLPEEIQVGRRAPVVITVHNAGSTTAHGVMVVDRVPRGAEFVDANPPVTPTADGLLIWTLGEMAAGDERTINLQIVPRSEGDIGSTFSVYSAVQGSVRTIATLPKLEIAYVAPPETLKGSQYDVQVTFRNKGTGIARNVRLEADLPTNLRHASGVSQLATMLDQLHPNQSVSIPLACIAAEPGAGQVALRAIIDDMVEAQQAIDMRVIAPELQAAMEGPNIRFLGRQVTFRLHLKNIGTAPATNGDMVLRLPAGLRFSGTINDGKYDSSQHAVFWSFVDLPAGGVATTEVTLLPEETGAQVLTFQASADLDVKAEAKSQLVVQGQAELAFSIDDDNDVIETSTSTTYHVNVTNMGNRPDQNVRLMVQIPADGSVVRVVDAPVKYELRGDQLLFEPLGQMDGRDQRSYRFEVEFSKPGAKVVRATLTSQNWPVPVTKEEGTHVYDDRGP